MPTEETVKLWEALERAGKSTKRHWTGQQSEVTILSADRDLICSALRRRLEVEMANEAEPRV